MNQQQEQQQNTSTPLTARQLEQQPRLKKRKIKKIKKNKKIKKIKKIKHRPKILKPKGNFTDEEYIVCCQYIQSLGDERAAQEAYNEVIYLPYLEKIKAAEQKEKQEQIRKDLYIEYKDYCAAGELANIPASDISSFEVFVKDYFFLEEVNKKQQLEEQQEQQQKQLQRKRQRERCRQAQEQLQRQDDLSKCSDEECEWCVKYVCE